MLRIILIASILIVVSINESSAQRTRRADRTSSGKAAYGLSTVSRSGKIGKAKKARSKKAVRRKTRAPKGKPGFRKVQNWAG